MWNEKLQDGYWFMQLKPRYSKSRNMKFHCKLRSLCTIFMACKLNLPSCRDIVTLTSLVARLCWKQHIISRRWIHFETSLFPVSWKCVPETYSLWQWKAGVEEIAFFSNWQLCVSVYEIESGQKITWPLEIFTKSERRLQHLDQS